MNYTRKQVDPRTLRFAGFESTGNPADAELALFGTQFEIITEDETAASFERGEHLLPWMGKEELLVDRFDARLLLDDLSTCIPSKRLASQRVVLNDTEEYSEADLDFERYADLDIATFSGSSDAYFNKGSVAWNQAPADAPSTSRFGDDYSSVGFSYNMKPENHTEDHGARPDQSELAEETTLQLPDSRENDVPFFPRFAVPDGLRSSIPKTERQHRIISQTAKFLREAGPQMEIVLRVKQGDHPNFTFLMPGDPLHDYFRWILKHNPTELVANAAPEAGAEAVEPEVTAETPAEPEPLVEGPVVNGLELIGTYEGQDNESETTTDGAQSPREVEQTTSGPDAEISTADTGDNEDNPAAAGMEDPIFPQPAGPCEHPEPAGSPEPGVPGLDEQVETEEVETEEVLNETVPLPPPDVQGIISKLVVFVKKHGPKFESVVREKEKLNAKFSFLLPWNQYHAYYNKQLVEALGEEDAEKVFNLRTAPAPAPVQPVDDAAQVEAQPSSQPASPEDADQVAVPESGPQVTAASSEAPQRSFIGPVPLVTLKANPSLLVVRKPKTAEPDAGGGESVAVRSSTNGGVKGETEEGVDEGKEQAAVGSPREDDDEDDDDGKAQTQTQAESVVDGETKAPQNPPKPKLELTDEMRQAIRRKLARKMLDQKRQAGVASVSAALSKASAIVHHRQALAAEVEEEELGGPGNPVVDTPVDIEPGEIPQEPVLHRDIAKPVEEAVVLPSLQDIIGPAVSLTKHRAMAFDFGDAQVLQVYKPPISPVNADVQHNRRRDANAATSSRSATSSSCDVSSDDDAHDKRKRHRSHKRTARATQSSEGDKDDKRQGRQHKRSKNSRHEGRHKLKKTRHKEEEEEEKKHKQKQRKRSREDSRGRSKHDRTKGHKSKKHKKPRHVDDASEDQRGKHRSHKQEAARKDRHRKTKKHKIKADGSSSADMSVSGSSSEGEGEGNGEGTKEVQEMEVPLALRAKVRALLDL